VQVFEGLVIGDRIVRANLGSLKEGLSARMSGPQTTSSQSKTDTAGAK